MCTETVCTPAEAASIAMLGLGLCSLVESYFWLATPATWISDGWGSAVYMLKAKKDGPFAAGVFVQIDLVISGSWP